MKKAELVICDPDPRYALSLSEYMNGRQYLVFQADPFTDFDKAMTHLTESETAILLISQTMVDMPDDQEGDMEKRGKEENPRGERNKHGEAEEAAGGSSRIELLEELWERKRFFIIVLTDTVRQQWHGFPCVLKLQSADRVIQSVMDLYAEGDRPSVGEDSSGGDSSVSPEEGQTDQVRLGGYRGEGSGKAAGDVLTAPAQNRERREKIGYDKAALWRDTGAKLIAVYSPVGRCGKTSFAVTLGELMAFHQRVLYVNLEDYSGFPTLTGEAEKGDLSDLLYFSRVPGGRLLYKMNGMIHTWERLDYIMPPFSSGDLREISAEEWCVFFSRLAAEGEYERIILDLGTQVEQVFRIMEVCARVYVPVLEGTVCEAKRLQFAANLELIGARMKDRVRYLYLPEPGKEEQGTRLGFPERIVRGRMGDYVKKLLRSEEKEYL